ncbi:M61 family metallopeptidase [Sphingomonas oryzagri]|uniref:Peptidase M61 n=1 Tax=Sphingomonas oryzagri TaxID=3042314 RepID=A0ABT6N7H3_9SPHN|nr:peptidase M61 [Sphingomonas oryzagri]MDH7641040.1 peptidase M61 [Sphingomonas oryzagri]
MFSLSRLALGVAPLALIAGAAHAGPQPAGNSLPQPVTITDTIPAPQDTPYPGGTIQLAVDATDVTRGIFSVKEVIPVAQGGKLTLLFPKWLPGNHSATGQISKIAGIAFSVDGKTIPWVRDTVDVYAFHLDLPADAKAVTATFQYLSPTKSDQGRVVATPDMLSLQWDCVAFYPAGYFVRQIPFSASVQYPKGWKSATALAPGLSGDTVTYPTVDFETLVDSPTIAGRNMVSHDLAPGVKLDIAADRPDQLVATPEQLAPHRKLVEQAIKLFGAQHYDHYDFLFTLSDNLGGEGLEHHRSSEDGTGADYFTDWANQAPDRNLLAHEFTHSWDGKFRRPADLWTPDYRTPMQDTLLWVYEGQTQFWGYVLQARSGLGTKQEILDSLAATAAYYQNSPAKDWRSVEDTTNDPIIAQRRPKGWTSFQWSEDYYEAGKLVWLDADQLIREKTGGKKSLDDFARAFFGVRDRDWGVLTYRFQDVVDTLNKVMPYDWATFLNERINQPGAKFPLDWITRGGYKLVYQDTPTSWWKQREKGRKIVDLSYSIGLTISSGDSKGAISGVFWGSPAFDAGVTVGSKLLAVNGRDYDKDLLTSAITAAKADGKPIHLLIKQADQYRDVAITWRGGLRYPTLEKVGKGETGLDKLLAPK